MEKVSVKNLRIKPFKALTSVVRHLLSHWLTGTSKLTLPQEEAARICKEYGMPQRASPVRIYDAFMFNSELDMLEVSGIPHISMHAQWRTYFRASGVLAAAMHARAADREPCCFAGPAQ